MDPESATSQTFSSARDTDGHVKYGKNAPPGYQAEEEKELNPTSPMMFKSVSSARERATVILLILMAIPVTMIVVGTINFKKCTMQKMIPIWLVVFGALSIIKNVSTLFQRLRNLRNREESNQSSNILLNLFDSFMALFLIIWFICGNIWTYNKIDKYQYTDPSEIATYCDRFTFLFAFWIITSIYIVILLACLLFCCTICFTIFIPTKK